MNIDINEITQSYISQSLKLFEESFYIPNNDIISNIQQRLVFVDYIERNVSLFQNIMLDNRFIKSLQAYLLFSASDSLGNKKKFYSFNEHITKKNCLPILEKYIHKELEITELAECINSLYKDYENEQSVKQSFFSFWNSRSEYIKKKIVLCYHPYTFDDYDRFYKKIIDTFYKVYRNPFTHSSLNNFPPIHSLKSAPIVTIQESIGVAFKDKTGQITKIELPLFLEEAIDIFSRSTSFYFIDDTGKLTERLFSKPEELMQWNITLCSYKNEISEPHYVHNGILKLLEMAIIEGCEEYKENA